MDIEKLTKQQIVLVTLLVSFVTSIATGIVTVALMDQAPPGVTQTINRVVERTVERVVTEPANNNDNSTIIRETVVVKEDDQIVESVDKLKNSVVRIYTNNKNEESQQVFVGLGTIVSKDGLIATGDMFADPKGKYLVTIDNQNFYEVSIVPKTKDNRLYFLQIIQDIEKPITFSPVILSDSNTIKLGQTVISFSGIEQNNVAIGIVSSLIDENNTGLEMSTSTVTDDKKIISLNTSIVSNDNIFGGPLINLYGEMIAIKVSANISGKYSLLPANFLKEEIKLITNI